MLASLACTTSTPTGAKPEAPAVPDYPASMRRVHTYYTGGVHNDKDCQPESKCVYERQPGEPTDPPWFCLFDTDCPPLGRAPAAGGTPGAAGAAATGGAPAPASGSGGAAAPSWADMKPRE